ncbi:MAG: thioredoxin-disulfide reductase [Bacteroidales bacterium]|jgi:thioredoxin reductase (NADPH)|nr:thioredoxin-disulfide reductase [Bacteroidales bacterium]MCI1733905.1 thioredoxin-disulfide reductase [Bacteroidales bacterium]
MERIKCLIAGSGPAGYTAAIYAARANLNPVIYSGMELGGQLTTTTTVDNFPGFPDGIDGGELVARMKQQAERFGVDVRSGVITKTDFSKRPFTLTIDTDKEVLADTVIIATGASAKYLNIPGEQKFRGSGVSACATCDGFFYKNKEVAVVGGGDTACEEAVYLSGICKKVSMIVRRDVFRASKAMQERVASKENIEVLWQCEPLEVVGDESGVTGVKILDKKLADRAEAEVVNGKRGVVRIVPVWGMFLAVGHHPNSEVFKPWINMDAEGYVITEPGSPKTNVPGIFAAGDVADLHYKQAITAAAAGCKAAVEVDKFLQGE